MGLEKVVRNAFANPCDLVGGRCLSRPVLAVPRRCGQP
jgi:hypothetical protein